MGVNFKMTAAQEATEAEAWGILREWGMESIVLPDTLERRVVMGLNSLHAAEATLGDAIRRGAKVPERRPS